MSGPAADPQPDQSAAPETQGASSGKAIVVGIYGLPGSGKSTLLKELKQKFGLEQFAFYEGAEEIANEVDGGLEAFQNLVEPEKERVRQRAIDKVGEECIDSGKVAVVAGHFLFWDEGKECEQPVWTQNDLNTFTHILYLDVPAEDVFQYRLDDTGKSHPSMSVKHLRQWQHAEKIALRRLCYENCILFSVVKPPLPNKVSTLLREFQHHTEKRNLAHAQSLLGAAFSIGTSHLETVLVLDADKTLAAKDTGALFWEQVAKSQPSTDESCPLKTLFGSPMRYSHTAFRQVALLYEETANDADFDKICQDVASEVTMYSEFVSLLQTVAAHDHVGAVIVTCGLRRIWEKVLEKEGLSEKVKVIGSGRIGDGVIVTAEVKGELVSRLKDDHGMYVYAFGDSPLDLGMLSMADQAIVVVGEEQTRSKTIEKELESAIDTKGLQARQVVLPSNASPRLDTTKLPLVQLTEQDFVDSVLYRRTRRPVLEITIAPNKNAANLLATKMRDAKNAGPTLRKAHRRVGWYLAVEFLTNVIGVGPTPIKHVQGRQETGSQLFHEEKTTIVALMRGGEPMALGVNDAFPLAMFFHAHDAEDLQLHHLEGQLTVILVDSVVNTGKSIVEFVQRVRKLHATIRIVVVAGVVQAKNVSESGLKKKLARYGKIHLVALRLSDTSFVGSRTTDTGNRLFNTMHLP